MDRLFKDYDRDEDGKITKQDYVDFYTDKAIQKPDVVWSNLNCNGIGNDLKPYNTH